MPTWVVAESGASVGTQGAQSPADSAPAVVRHARALDTQHTRDAQGAARSRGRRHPLVRDALYAGNSGTITLYTGQLTMREMPRLTGNRFLLGGSIRPVRALADRLWSEFDSTHDDTWLRKSLSGVKTDDGLFLQSPLQGFM